MSRRTESNERTAEQGGWTLWSLPQATEGSDVLVNLRCKTEVQDNVSASRIVVEWTAIGT